MNKLDLELIDIMSRSRDFVFRNLNGHLYIVDKRTNQKHYYGCGHEVHHLLIEFEKQSKNDTSLTDNQRNYIVNVLRNYRPTLAFIRKSKTHLLNTLPNTAENQEEGMDQIWRFLPNDMVNEVLGFLPDDTNGKGGNDIKNIVKHVLLPENEVLQKLAEFMPFVLQNTDIAHLCLEYVNLFAFNHIAHVLRNKFCDEFHSKKCKPATHNKFKPIREEDGKDFCNKIFLGKKAFSNFGIESTIKYGFDTLFCAELFGKMNLRTDYTRLTSFFNGVRHTNLYRPNWENDLPVLLTDKTNYLTEIDKSSIKQYPVWIKYILTVQEDKATMILKSITPFKETIKTEKIQIKKELKKIEKYLY